MAKLRLRIETKLLKIKRWYDVSSFHKLFESETGLSPGMYRTKFSLL